MNTKETFANRFSELCGDRSQAEIANEIGIARATVGYYRSGDRSPDVTTLFRIAQYFGVTADYLIGLSDAKQPENSDIVERLGLTEEVITKLEFVKKYRNQDDSSEYSELKIINDFIILALKFDLFLNIEGLCKLMKEGLEDSRFTSAIFDIEYKEAEREWDDPDYRSLKLKELQALKERAKKYGCKIIGAGEEVKLKEYEISQTMNAILAVIMSPLKPEYTIETTKRQQELLGLGGETDGDD